MGVINKKQALAYTGLDKKTFENYVIGQEFKCLPRKGNRGRFYFDEDELLNWLTTKAQRTVELDLEDYALCLDFALAQHFRHYVTSDFGTGRQREFGQKLTNWIKGQLGEVAVMKFFKEHFNFDVLLDFEIHNDIVPQDIIGVIENGQKRPPRIGIGIKSSKPKNVFLVLGENEISLPDRRSDVYILCRPDIPDDHILRITKNAIQIIVEEQPYYVSYRDKMPDFDNISCEVVGWCSYDELELKTEIPGQVFDGSRYVLPSGKLKRSPEEWRSLIDMI
ncbi:MAG: hypothetical protein WC750_03075 [Patescibacteria group bacterium]|jgi:hypothetical protein